MIPRTWIAEAHNGYVKRWLLPKWTGRDLHADLPALILWYSIAGSAWGNDAVADATVTRVHSEGPEVLPLSRPKTWQHAKRLRNRLSRLALHPVDWFTSGDLEEVWESLDDIAWIGPKIASFLMRDVSFLRDYWSPGRQPPGFGSQRDATWFASLEAEQKALFLPVDRYVYDHAKQHGASPTAIQEPLEAVQQDPRRHRAVAEEIVQWCNALDADPRDVDVYWYSLGAGNIREDGTEIE